jgi:arginase
MTHVDLILVPYDSGQRAVRMGRGPEHLVDRGLGDALADDGHHVTVTRVESSVEPAAEVAVTFDLARNIATAVRAAREDGRLPLVLAGNCISALGTVAGLGSSHTGVLWLDAHGDLNTPETTHSGLLDGMALATLTGRCWRGLAATVPGFAPFPDHRIALIGARDLDPPEEALAAALGIRRLGAADLARLGARQAIAPLVGRMAQTIDRFYVHVDLDVLDPAVASVNEFAAPGGLSLEEVLTVVDMAARSSGIAAASLTAYDPAGDDDGRAVAAAVAIARAIAAGVARGQASGSVTGHGGP